MPGPRALGVFVAILGAWRAAPPPVPASAWVAGLVTDSADRPIGGAAVLVTQLGGAQTWETRSAADGRYVLAIGNVDSVRVTVRKLGYVAVASPSLRVHAGDTTRFDARLMPSPVTLGRVTVLGIQARAGFEQRRDSRRGTFLDSAAIARMPAERADQLVAESNGATFTVDPRGLPIVGRQKNCRPNVIVDGWLVPDPLF